MTVHLTDQTPLATAFPHGAEIVELSSPPKPTLAFRVGIVGHRPDRLSHADTTQLGHIIRLILETVQKEVIAFSREQAPLFSPAPPIFRAVSPLAEGADRLFAEQALDLGWELCSVMPFLQGEYEKDFHPGKSLEPDSLTRFHSILDSAGKAKRLTCFQLEGNRDKDGAAYGAAGRVVLNQSDLLLIIWDGERQNKRGGTEETFDEARQRGVPLLWIDAQAPHTWQWVYSELTLPELSPQTRAVPDGSGTPETLGNLVRHLLAVPEPCKTHVLKTQDQISLPTSRENLERFYVERKPLRSLAFLWKAFRDVVADVSFPKITIRVEPFEQAVLDEWPANRDTPVAAMVDGLRPYYAWPDKLSVLYADRYRSAFILAFMFTAVSVALALAPIGFQLRTDTTCEEITTFLELTAIATIVAVTLLGRKNKWHERWLDYRLAAELLRHLRVVAAIGGERPFPRSPAHHAAHDDPSATWMNWYVRAVARSFGLPNSIVDRNHLMDSLAQLEKLLLGQIRFHEVNARRSYALEHRLHVAIVFLLAAAMSACCAHMLHLFPSGWLTFLCGVCPAVGAALAGIINQGEFRRVAKRSLAMQWNLNNQLTKLIHLREQAPAIAPDLFADRVGHLVSDSARLLVNEVLDWRVIFLDRPLELAQ